MRRFLRLLMRMRKKQFLSTGVAKLVGVLGATIRQELLENDTNTEKG